MTLDLTAGVWRLRVTYGADALNGPLLSRLLEEASVLRGCPLERFKYERDGSNPNLYDYRIWLTDGREWRQSILFSGANDTNPILTFHVEPGWRLTEFLAHRAWRDLMVELRNALGATLVRVDRV